MAQRSIPIVIIVSMLLAALPLHALLASPTIKMENFGDIKSINRPWDADPNTGNSQSGRAFSFVPPSASSKTRISFIEHGDPMARNDEPALHKLLSSKSTASGSVLFDATDAAAFPQAKRTFVSISSILGGLNVGDNQLTSGKGRAPAFHLQSARLQSINGKTVLAVNGTFAQLDDKGNIKKDSHGPLKRFYSGIFADGSGNNSPIELYLQSDDKKSFDSSKDEFHSLLQSIEWAEGTANSAN